MTAAPRDELASRATVHEMGVAEALTADPREPKLPVWAQGQLTRLRQLLNDSEAAARTARLATNPTDSNTHLVDYTHGPIGLGQSPKVQFLLPDGTQLVANVDDRTGELYIRGYGGGIVVRPQANNAVTIRSDRHRPPTEGTTTTP